MEMRKLLVQYLNTASNDRFTLERDICSRPDEAVDAILSFSGPYPKNLNAKDIFPDYLSPLLTSLLLRFPRLFSDQTLAKLSPAKRGMLTTAAISAEDPQFAKTILAGLQDRSIEVIMLAVHAIIRYTYLQTPDSKPQLQKLLDTKSLIHCHNDVQRALELITRS